MDNRTRVTRGRPDCARPILNCYSIGDDFENATGHGGRPANTCTCSSRLLFLLLDELRTCYEHSIEEMPALLAVMAPVLAGSVSPGVNKVHAISAFTTPIEGGTLFCPRKACEVESHPRVLHP